MRGLRPANRSLPPELEFIIIDHLSTAKPALASCSLVCSRWLPPSRRHLFRDIALKPAMRLNPTLLEDFLRILDVSGEVNPQRIIGPCVRNLTIDGSDPESHFASPVLICSLSFLHGLLFKLPLLASLCLRHLLMPNDLATHLYPEQSRLMNFKLDQLIVSGCTADGHDPHHLLALISMFSNIDSLSILQWGNFMADPIYEVSLSTLSPPLVRSLEIAWVSEGVAPAIYALFANSSSVTNGHFTHVYLDTWADTELLDFSNFANASGLAFRKVNLRASSHLFSPSELLDGVSLANCGALRSLVFCMEPIFENDAAAGHSHAEDTRDKLSTYAWFFRRHRNALPMLSTIRFEMQPVGSWMLDAFARVARDTFPEWPSKVMKMVAAEEAEQNKQLWTSLEDDLDSFPALERLEFVLYETKREALTEEAKVQLRSALEGRLPRLWPSGVAQLVFQPYVYRGR